jgi:hypothetical protein
VISSPAELVYVLCALASVTCAVLLFRAYRHSRTQLLFWSAVAFCLLAGDNIVLFLDLVVIRNYDLRALRTGVGLAGLCVLLYALIWNADSE